MECKELFKKGEELFFQRRFNESIDLFNQAAAEGYDPVSVHLSIGAACLNDAQYDRAMQEFSKIVAIDGENDRAFFYRGIAYMNKGDYPCAIADFNNAISRNRNRPTAYLARAIAEIESDREQEAVKDFKRAVSFSAARIRSFGNLFGSTMTSLDRTMALLEGEKGSLSKVLTPAEMEKLKLWLD